MSTLNVIADVVTVEHYPWHDSLVLRSARFA